MRRVGSYVVAVVAFLTAAVNNAELRAEPPFDVDSLRAAASKDSTYPFGVYGNDGSVTSFDEIISEQLMRGQMTQVGPRSWSTANPAPGVPRTRPLPSGPPVLTPQDATRVKSDVRLLLEGKLLEVPLSSVSSRAPMRSVPRTIFGPDERYRINPTTSYSANAIGHLSAKNPSTGLTRSCSAEVYGPDVIVTAAHCIHTGGPSGVWLNTWRFSRGRNGTSYPYGTCNGTGRAWVLGGWVSTGPQSGSYSKWDLGVVEMSCTFPGTYGAGLIPQVNAETTTTSSSWCDSLVICTFNGWVTGYPGSKAGQMWEGAGIWYYVPDAPWAYSTYIDLTSGQSGGYASISCDAYGWVECQFGVISSETSSNNYAHRHNASDISFLAWARDVA